MNDSTSEGIPIIKLLLLSWDVHENNDKMRINGRTINFFFHKKLKLLKDVTPIYYFDISMTKIILSF